jgi:hypothetical protein
MFPPLTGLILAMPYEWKAGFPKYVVKAESGSHLVGPLKFSLVGSGFAFCLADCGLFLMFSLLILTFL